MISTREIATVDEVPGLLEIWRASAATGRELVSAADMDRLAQALEAVYLGNARVVVAEREGQVVGSLALERARLWPALGAPRAPPPWRGPGTYRPRTSPQL
ncbi:hypothetical protein [Arthrobacter sp. JCM 19049]|uniref:hypothetical protein n=1 Tax=Arthrobacter sp. JCM 19049 TaxID=1460643 RepID=UPI0006CFF98B|nr:hypothetical protein [Arthrobacter sp. JCM 19049]